MGRHAAGSVGGMDDKMVAICADLEAEYLELAAVVAPLEETAWDMPTPAEGWAIRDQIAHLAFFDDKAVEAHLDPEAFAAELAGIAGSTDMDDYVAIATDRAAAMQGTEILEWWTGANERLRRVYSALDAGTRVLWYGQPMGARSKVTARIMETWAHGQDVRDALGIEEVPVGRLRHVCHIGVAARPYAFRIRGLPVPDIPPYVELTLGDETWTWGDPDSPESLRGSALGFALVATQRRHRVDTDLVATGSGADEWLDVAQAFAGPPGPGRPPLG